MALTKKVRFQQLTGLSQEDFICDNWSVIYSKRDELVQSFIDNIHKYGNAIKSLDKEESSNTYAFSLHLLCTVNWCVYELRCKSPACLAPLNRIIDNVCATYGSMHGLLDYMKPYAQLNRYGKIESEHVRQRIVPLMLQVRCRGIRRSDKYLDYAEKLAYDSLWSDYYIKPEDKSGFKSHILDNDLLIRADAPNKIFFSAGVLARTPFEHGTIDLIMELLGRGLSFEEAYMIGRNLRHGCFGDEGDGHDIVNSMPLEDIREVYKTFDSLKRSDPYHILCKYQGMSASLTPKVSGKPIQTKTLYEADVFKGFIRDKGAGYVALTSGYCVSTIADRIVTVYNSIKEKS